MFGIQSGSIQQRLFIPQTVTILLLFGLGSVFTYLVVRNALVLEIDNHLKRTSEDFIAETERTVSGEIESEFHDLDLTHFRSDGDGGASFYELYDAEGSTIVKSRSLNDNHLTEISDGTYATALLGKGIKVRTYSTKFTVPFEALDPNDPRDLAGLAARTSEEVEFVEIYDPNLPRNQVTLTVAENLTNLTKTLVHLRLILALTGFLLATVTFFVLFRIIRVVCEPVSALARKTEEIRPESLDVRLPTEALPSEIKPLVVKVNELIGRLDEAMQRERRFAIDIAHELRTPVAEIRALMEVAVATKPVSHFDSSEGSSYDFFRIGADISVRMSRLIEVLTSIHKGTSGDYVTASEPVDFESIFSKAVGALGLADSDEKRIQLSGKQSEIVESDATLLRAIADNLLTNALTWSPPGSTISVKYTDDSIVVANRTNLLAADDLKNLEKAFWQKDGARTESDHFGLGLTLVSVYVRLLGGTIKHELKGDLFSATVVLP